MPKNSLPILKTTPAPRTRKKIQQKMSANPAPDLPQGMNNVYTEKDPRLTGHTYYIKSKLELEKLLSAHAGPADLPNESELIAAQEQITTPVIPGKKALEAEDLPDRQNISTSSITLSAQAGPAEPSSDAESIATTQEQIVVPKIKALEAEDLPNNQQAFLVDKLKLLNQLETASAAIARAFCSRRFPQVKPIDDFNCLQSQGFERFQTINELEQAGHNLDELAKRFVENGGGAIIGVCFLLQDSDTHIRNIGFSDGLAVGIDTGMYFAPLFFEINAKKRLPTQQVIWNLYPISDMLIRANAIAYFAELATSITLGNAYYISDEILCQLPKASRDSKQPNAGYRPLNGFDACFNWDAQENNLEKFFFSEQCRKDLLQQLLIAIIVYDTGFIKTILNQYPYDELLKHRILNLVAQRISTLKKVLFDQNNQIHQELRAVMTESELMNALEQHVQYYNRNAEHENFQIDLQACQTKAQELMAELKKPLLPRTQASASAQPKITREMFVKLASYLGKHYSPNTTPLPIRNVSDKDAPKLFNVLIKAHQMINSGFCDEKTLSNLKAIIIKACYSKLNADVLEESLRERYARYLILKDAFFHFRKTINLLSRINKDNNLFQAILSLFKNSIQFIIQYFFEKPTEVKLFVTKIKSISVFFAFISDHFAEIKTQTHALNLLDMYLSWPVCETQPEKLAQEIMLGICSRLNISPERVGFFLSVLSAIIQSHALLLSSAKSKQIFCFIAEKLFSDDQDMSRIMRERLPIIQSETDVQLLEFAFNILFYEFSLEHPRFLSVDDFASFYSFIKKLKSDNPEQFNLLLNSDCFNFLIDVCLITRGLVNVHHREFILSSALCWFEDANNGANIARRRWVLNSLFLDGSRVIHERSILLQVEDDRQILELCFSVVFREASLDSASFLSSMAFENFYHLIKQLKSNHPEKFDLLLNPVCFNFLIDVFSATHHQVDTCGQENILFSALHWFEQAGDDINPGNFLESIKQLAASNADFDNRFASLSESAQACVIKSTLFELTYEHELIRIEKQLQSLQLVTALKTLNGKSRKFAYGGHEAAAIEACNYCERSVALFSKGANLREVNISPLENFTALKKHRGFGLSAFFKQPHSYELAKEINCGVRAISLNQKYLEERSRRVAASLGG